MCQYISVTTQQRGISTINGTGWTRGRAKSEIMLHSLEEGLPSRAVGNDTHRLLVQTWSGILNFKGRVKDEMCPLKEFTVIHFDEFI